MNKTRNLKYQYRINIGLTVVCLSTIFTVLINKITENYPYLFINLSMLVYSLDYYIKKYRIVQNLMVNQSSFNFLSDKIIRKLLFNQRTVHLVIGFFFYLITNSFSFYILCFNHEILKMETHDSIIIIYSLGYSSVQFSNFSRWLAKLKLNQFANSRHRYKRLLKSFYRFYQFITSLYRMMMIGLLLYIIKINYINKFMLSFFLYIFIRTLVNLYKFKRALLAKFFYLILLVIIIIDTIIQFGNNRLYQYKFFFVFILQLVQMTFDFAIELIQAFNLLNQQNIYQNQRRIQFQASNLFYVISQHIQNQNQNQNQSQGLTESQLRLLKIIKCQKDIYLKRSVQNEQQPDPNQQHKDEKNQQSCSYQHHNSSIEIKHQKSSIDQPNINNEMDIPIEFNQNDKQIDCQTSINHQKKNSQQIEQQQQTEQQQQNEQQQIKNEHNDQADRIDMNRIQIDLEQSILGANNNQMVFNCIICESSISENDDIYDLKCQHIFHAGCLKPWILNNSTCPLCRYQIKDQLKNENHEH